MRNKFAQTASLQTLDDQQLVKTIGDIAAGINTRSNDSRISDTQSTALTNVELSVIGERSKRKGSTSIANDVGAISPVALNNFEIQGATDQLLMFENTTLWKWVGAGNWASIKADFTAATSVSIVNGKESGLSPDDIVIIQDGTNNAIRIDSDGNEQDLGDTNTSPPLTRVGTWYGNRFWYLKNDELYYSDAYDSDYSGAFDRTTNKYRIPVGEEKAIVPTRDSGMVVFGLKEVWAFAPSVTPAATDQPQPFVTNVGCVAENTVVPVGDDIYWLAQDGVRSLKRTLQDKMQLGVDYPLSYNLKDSYETINWGAIDKACAVYFDNKYILSLPVNNSATNNEIWVYYPPTQGWSKMSGINASCFATYKVSGEERLYYGEATADGVVYQLLTGTDDNGSDIQYTEETKAHDMGYPLNYKFGGELTLRCADNGGTITVYYQIDDNGWVQLGTLDTTGAGVTFPTAFPVIFYESGIVEGKFHLDSIGERWRKIEFKFDETSSDNLKILDYSIVTYFDQYENE